MRLTWLGRSCFQLTARDRTRVLFDPYLDLWRDREKSPFPPPDVICVSHGHLDHFADVPDLVRGDSPALVVAIPRLCRALRKLVPETQHRLFPLPWDDQVDLDGTRFFSFRSPPMQMSLYGLYQEFDPSDVMLFLQACHQLADEFLYLPLTSFGVEADHLRLLHFVFEGEGDKDEEPVDIQAIGAQFAPDVALVGIDPGEEERSAEHAAALGAPLVIPHHYRAYGRLPAADMDVFTESLRRLSPGTELLFLKEMESIEL